MTEYLTSYKIYAYLSSNWTDITPDVIADDIVCAWGINGNGPVDRIASTGSMNFTLNNTGGEYSPGLAGSLADWEKNTPVKLVVVYDSSTYVRFLGRVDALKIQPGTWGGERVEVTALDLVNQLAITSIANPVMVTNKTASEIISLSLGSITPENFDYDTGKTFPAVFDTVTDKTKIYGELSKVVLSELGYLYLTKDKDAGETLVFEDSEHRTGLSQLSLISVAESLSDDALDEAGNVLLLETGEAIQLDQTTTFEIDNSMQGMEVVYGQDLSNRFQVTAYPKKIDTTPAVLFVLDSPYLLPPGIAPSFRATYSYFDTGEKVNGFNMLAPVADVDYMLNTKADGTGTDLTAYLTVDAVYDSSGIDFSLVNSYTQAGWVTRLQAHGYAVHNYNPVSFIAENAVSIAAYGENSQTIDQKYQVNLIDGEHAAQMLLNEYKKPRTVVNRVDLVANKSGELMEAFLKLDVGSMLSLKEAKTGVDGYYYIQDEKFSISLGGLVRYSWGLKEAYTREKDITLLSASVLDVGEAINYGYIPRLANLGKRTYTGWMNLIQETSAAPRYFISPCDSDYAGTILYPSQTGRQVKVYTKNITDGGLNIGRWRTPNNVWSVDTWCFVAMTRDTDTYGGDVDPIIYINAVAQALTEEYTPSTILPDEAGGLMVLGNIKTATQDYTYPMYGELKDCRVYNRVLTPAEISTIYTGNHLDSVTDGLLFQGPAVLTRDLAEYDGLWVGGNNYPVLEAIHYTAGTVHGPMLVNAI